MFRQRFLETKRKVRVNLFFVSLSLSLSCFPFFFSFSVAVVIYVDLGSLGGRSVASVCQAMIKDGRLVTLPKSEKSHGKRAAVQVRACKIQTSTLVMKMCAFKGTLIMHVISRRLFIIIIFFLQTERWESSSKTTGRL